MEAIAQCFFCLDNIRKLKCSLFCFVSKGQREQEETAELSRSTQRKSVFQTASN